MESKDHKFGALAKIEFLERLVRDKANVTLDEHRMMEEIIHDIADNALVIEA